MAESFDYKADNLGDRDWGGGVHSDSLTGDHHHQTANFVYCCTVIFAATKKLLLLLAVDESHVLHNKCRAVSICHREDNVGHQSNEMYEIAL